MEEGPFFPEQMTLSILYYLVHCIFTRGSEKKSVKQYGQL